MPAEAAVKKGPAAAQLQDAASKAASATTPPAKKKGKLPWLIVGAVVLLGGGVATWLALKPTSEPAKAAAAPSAPRAAPIYYKFDPAFVVNFGGEGSARYLQVTVEAMSRDAQILDQLKNNEPAVRNDLVLLFSSQDNATLMTAEGKEKLRATALETIRHVLTGEGFNGALIEAVYFTSFVIQ